MSNKNIMILALVATALVVLSGACAAAESDAGNGNGKYKATWYVGDEAVHSESFDVGTEPVWSDEPASITVDGEAYTIVGWSEPVNANNGNSNKKITAILGSVFTYEYDDDELTATLTGYTGTATEIVIPETVEHDGETYTVTEIGDRVFFEDNLTSVTLPEGLKVISEGAFKYVGVKGSEHYARIACDITIPSSVTTIGFDAFIGFVGTVSFADGSSIESIGSRAFVNVSFGDATVSNLNFTAEPDIDYTNFVSNGGLIPDEVYDACMKKLTDDAFTYTYKVIGNKEYVATLTGYTGTASDISIPETVEYNGNTYTVKAIASDAFAHNGTIVSVTVPATVTSVGARAFTGCGSLTSVDFGAAQVSYMGDSAFSSSGIESIDMSGFTITAIKTSTFNTCKSLRDVTLPGTLKSVGDLAFKGCSALENVDLGSIEEICRSAFEFAGSGTTEITIPATVVTIWPSAFFKFNGAVTFEDGSSIQTIGWRAFNDQSSRTENLTVNNLNFSGSLRVCSANVVDDETGRYASGGKLVLTGCTYTEEGKIPVLYQDDEKMVRIYVSEEPVCTVRLMSELRTAIENGEESIVFDTSDYSDETIDRAEFRVGRVIAVDGFNLTITGNGTLSYAEASFKGTMFTVSDGGKLVIDGATIMKSSKTVPTVKVDSGSEFEFISGTMYTNYGEKDLAVDGEYTIGAEGEIVVPGTVTVSLMSELRTAIENGQKNIVFDTSGYFDETIDRAEFRVGRVIAVDGFNLTITGNGTLSYDETNYKGTMFTVSDGGKLVIDEATIMKSSKTVPTVKVDSGSKFEFISGTIYTNFTEKDLVVDGEYTIGAEGEIVVAAVQEMPVAEGATVTATVQNPLAVTIPAANAPVKTVAPAAQVFPATDGKNMVNMVDLMSGADEQKNKTVINTGASTDIVIETDSDAGSVPDVASGSNLGNVEVGGIAKVVTAFVMILGGLYAVRSQFF